MVFTGVSFKLRASDALLLRGPNGSGKTSLLRLLAGFLNPAAGALSWEERPIADDPTAHRARVHYVGHANGIKGTLTVRENLAFAAALCSGSSERIEQTLDVFDLAALADVQVLYLSAGQRRRVSLARLLAARRPIWLLDEPDAGLDALNRAHLAEAIAEHRAAGGVAIVATHGDIEVGAAQVLELAP